MAVQQVLRKIGQWSVKLTSDAPAGLLSQLDYFGHVAVIPGAVNPVERGDDCLAMARYVGILRDLGTTDALTLGGVGLESWLGDEDGKGENLENPGVSLTGSTFAAAIAALVPSSVPVGTVHAGVAGTVTNDFTYQSRRTAIDWVCDTMGGEWKVRPDGYLDAGPASTLFRTTPACVIARRDVAGYDMSLRALSGTLESTRSVKDYTTRVVIVAQALAGGTADVPSTPYKDLHGNDVAMTRIVDETDDTSALSAPARAQAVLNLFSGPRKAVRLSVDDFDVAGDFTAGDVVWVWDPDAGLSDDTYEVPFRGRLLNPVPVRVLSLTWPVTRGYTVAYRSSTGAWVDLTPWVDWESASGGEVEVADSMSSALTSGIGSIGTTVAGGGGGAGDTAIPDVPTFGTFVGTSYQPQDGLPKAAVKVTWSQPLNTDSSTIVDGDHYDLRYRPTGTTDWQLVSVPFDQLSTTISNLPPSTGYDWQIRAVDYASPVNYGAWSSTTAYSTPADTTAPGVPAAPAVAASLIAVQVTHTLGLASGGTYNLPLDMDHFEVHVDVSSGFTPSTASLVGMLKATSVELAGSIPVVGTFQVDTIVGAGAVAYVKVIAVDRTGNRSTASSAASATAQLIDSAHITSLTASKITAGTITAAVVIGGSATFSGALSAATGTFAGSLSAATGTFAGSLSAASGTFAGSLSAATGSFSGSISASTITGTTITGTTLKTATSGARVEVGAGSGIGYINFYDSGGNNGYIRAGSSGGSNELGMYSGSGSTWVQAHGSNASLNYSGGGVVSATSSGWTGQNTGGTAFVTGSGNTLSVDAGSTVNIGTSFNPTINVGTGGSTVSIGASGSTINLSGTAIGIGNAGPAATGIALHKVSGQLRPVSSSRRYKGDIEYVDVTPEQRRAVLDLGLVTYADQCFIDEAGGDASRLPHYWGVIAEDVAGGPLDPLVIRGDDGQLESFMYDRLTVLLARVLRDVDERVSALEAAA